jgi:hypothetical protein
MRLLSQIGFVRVPKDVTPSPSVAGAFQAPVRKVRAMNQTGKDRAVAGIRALSWASLAVAASELFAPQSVQTLLGLDDHR